jgi:hypothetical protein
MDIVSLLSSKLTNDPDQGRLQFALPNFLSCLQATNHLGLYDFLFDSYIAIATLNDQNWRNDKPIEKNVHVMLKRIRDDVIKMMAFLAKKGGQPSCCDPDGKRRSDAKCQYDSSHYYERRLLEHRSL